MENQQYLNKQGEELRMLFQVIVDDIKWAKVHQFRIVYYILLIFAAVIIFCTKIGGECGNIPIVPKLLFLLVPAFVINALGLYHIMDTQKKLCIYRKRILEFEPSFTNKARSILEIRDEDKRDYTRFTKYYFKTITFPLTVVIMIGLFWVAWFLFRDSIWICLVSVLVWDGMVLWCSYLKNRSDLNKLTKKPEKVKSPRLCRWLFWWAR